MANRRPDLPARRACAGRDARTTEKPENSTALSNDMQESFSCTMRNLGRKYFYILTDF
jgi:hypothetical protein